METGDGLDGERYMTVKKDAGKGAGMGLFKKEKTRMTFRCNKTREEVVGLLNTPRFEDNLSYIFFEEHGADCFSVTKLPYQLGKRRPTPYRMWFEQGEDALYLLIEEKEAVSVMTASAQEPEVYRFFIEKCGCEPADRA